jgi:tetratricopeptide (TPR) repeat protein
VETWEDVESLINQREFKRAEVMLAKRLRHDLPSNEKALGLLYRAKLRLLTGRANDSVVDLEEIESLASTTQTHSQADYLEVVADAHFQRYEQATVGFADKNDLNKARITYQTLIAKHTYYVNLGWIYYQFGRLELISGNAVQAEKYYRAALFQPSYVTALTAYCYERLAYVSLYEHRDYRQALVFIDKAIATYPQNDSLVWLLQSYLLKSKIYQYLDLGKALDSAKKALSLASNGNMGKIILTEALFAVADLASKSRGLEQDVIEYAQQFLYHSKTPIGIDVTWSRIHEMLGDAFFALGRNDAAINAYLNMLQFNPYHPWDNAIKLRIAHCYQRIGQHHKVVELLQQVTNNVDVSGDYQAYEMLGHSLLALERRMDATVAFEQARRLAPHGITMPNLPATNAHRT